MIPRLISQTLAGWDVAKPRIVAICIRNQYAAVSACECGSVHELHDRHPGEVADLERDKGERVGLQRRDDAVAPAEVAHRFDREVLERDAEDEREREVDGVLRIKRKPEQLKAERARRRADGRNPAAGAGQRACSRWATRPPRG